MSQWDPSVLFQTWNQLPPCQASAAYIQVFGDNKNNPYAAACEAETNPPVAGNFRQTEDQTEYQYGDMRYLPDGTVLMWNGDGWEVFDTNPGDDGDPPEDPPEGGFPMELLLLLMMLGGGGGAAIGGSEGGMMGMLLPLLLFGGGNLLSGIFGG